MSEFEQAQTTSGDASADVRTNTESSCDAVVVGAGFYQLYRLLGLGLSVRVIEAGSGVGGTWYWNRYPGARCDVESMAYSYQFSEELQQEWKWSERYASQPEILSYIEHVVERFSLRPHIQFSTRVLSVHFDEARSRWSIETSAGERISARFSILATGCLSSRNMPPFEGLDVSGAPIEEITEKGLVANGESYELDSIEATLEAEDEWVDHVNEVAGATLFMQANSWYLGANIPGKKRVFMPYVGGNIEYRRRCDESASDDYAGFELKG